jgi:group I intron endonuclease
MIVYLLLNMINSKGYVGQHRGNNISTRWPKNMAGANVHLSAARDKYGTNAFSREVLNYCSSQEEMNNLEKLWISTLRTYDPDYGYNMTFGGEGQEGKRCTPEVKKKLREVNLGKKNGIWITNGVENKVTKDPIPGGWYCGRTQKKYKSRGPDPAEKIAKRVASTMATWKKKREEKVEGTPLCSSKTLVRLRGLARKAAKIRWYGKEIAAEANTSLNPVNLGDKQEHKVVHPNT